MKTYRVKAINGTNLIDETFESKDAALDLYNKHANHGDPAYLYQDDVMINSFDPSYDEYLERCVYETSCVYCGANYPDGYCYLSPDGNHVMND